MARKSGSSKERAGKRARSAASAASAASKGSIGLVGGGNRAGSQLVKRSVDTQLNQRFGSDVTPLVLCPIKEGAGFYERVGQNVILKTIHVKGHLAVDFLSDAQASVSTNLRMLLVYDRESNGNTPTVADILLDQTTLGVGTTNVFSGLNLRERKRFHVFRDKRFYLTGPAPGFQAAMNLQVIGGEAANQGTNVDWYVKLNDLAQDYKAATGDVGAISAGALFLVCYSQSALAASRAVFTGAARLRYTMPGAQF